MSHSTKPFISVIVAVFNGDKTLQQCIESVYKQTYKNRELIIIDGGSTDGTVELLKANRERIDYWISEPDKGIYNAWNKGLKQAKGDWICFLGADDFFWSPEVLALVAEKLVDVPPQIRVAYSRIMMLDNDGQSMYPLGEPWVKERFKQLMSIPHPGLMHRRSLFEQHGEFDESFRIAGDYELLLRELCTSDAVFIHNVIIAGMRHGGISSSPENSLLSLREARRAQRNNGLKVAGLKWRIALIKTYIRLLLWKVLGEQLARRILDLGRRLKGLPPVWTRT